MMDTQGRSYTVRKTASVLHETRAGSGMKHRVICSSGIIDSSVNMVSWNTLEPKDRRMNIHNTPSQFDIPILTPQAVCVAYRI